MKKIYNLVYTICNQLKNRITYTIDIIINFMRKIKNFFYWGWKLRNDIDYDYTSIYYILHLKFNKMHKSITTEGYTRSAKSREMVDLKVCAHLAKELSEDLPRTQNYQLEDTFCQLIKKVKILEARQESQKKYFWKTLQKQIERWWT